MARVAQYTDALPVYVTPEVRKRIKDIADREQVSQAEVVRDIIDIGLPEREPKYRWVDGERVPYREE